MNDRARQRAAAAVGIASLLAGLLVIGADRGGAQTTSETYQRPASGQWTVDGHGWGHGIGMSQYGAQGAAISGVTTGAAITAFYYPGTTLTQQGNPTVRVGITAASTATLQVAAATGLNARDGASGQTWSLSGADRYRVLASGGGLALQAQTANGAWTAIGTATGLAGPVDFQDPAALLRLTFPDGSQRDYRGALRAVRAGSTLTTVDVVPMESYLLGVVPRESPSSFRPAALQAQAIAARTYAAFEAAGHAAAPFDICDSTSCQVFGGTTYISPTGQTTALEATSTNQAVQQTAGQIRTYNGQPIFSQYSSSDGGYTVQGSQPYLPAQPDPWDGVPQEDVHTWTATLKVTDIEQHYGAALGTFDSMTVTSRDGNGEWGGRVLSVVLHGHDSAGRPTTVNTTGTGIYQSHPWPQYGDGLRSNWWKPQAPAAGQLTTSAQLTAGQALTAPSGQYRLVMQGDGNAVVYGNGRALWSTGTASHPGARLIVQPDSNLVVYDANGDPLWSARTSGRGTAAHLALQNDGNLVLYTSAGAVWSDRAVGSDTLSAPAALSGGQYLHSPTGRYVAIMQGDGNLVVYDRNTWVWASKTSSSGSFVALQADGNLVIYHGANPVWSTRTAGTGSASRLVMQEDGNLVLYSAGRATWASKASR